MIIKIHWVFSALVLSPSAYRKRGRLGEGSMSIK
jgi:hypothetical protein